MKPGEQEVVKIEAPFTDEISSLAIIKLLGKLTQSVIVLKCKICMKCYHVRYGQQ